MDYQRIDKKRRDATHFITKMNRLRYRALNFFDVEPIKCGRKMAKKKKQHSVPVCYLSQWCDPHTPKGRTPYVWIYDKRSGVAKKKAPHNIFHDKDTYTILGPNGHRDLTIEDSLSTIETKYAEFIRNRLSFGTHLADEDKFLLCVFMATMCIRTKRWKDNCDGFLNGVLEKVKSLEKQHDTSDDKSSAIEEIKRHHVPVNIAENLQFLTNIFWSKDFLFFEAPRKGHFITSDDPCNVVNPSLPANNFYASPAPGQVDAEITMALSPRHLLLAKTGIGLGWKAADEKIVFQFNMRAQLGCHEYYVAHVRNTARLIVLKGDSQ